MADNTTEVTTGYIRLRSNGVVVFDYKDGAYETLETAKEAIATINKMTVAQDPVPLLVRLLKVKGQSVEARTYYASSDDANETVTKVALLIKSPVSRMMGNIYMGIQKPRNPTKLFTSEDEAVRWLLEK